MMSTNKDDRNEINELDIANGLKEILINHQFTIEDLCKLSAEDLSIALGIGDLIARMIKDAAKKLCDST
jgi:DNA integrity scanning protein DisA with diadenylate cyclase activity